LVIEPLLSLAVAHRVILAGATKLAPLDGDVNETLGAGLVIKIATGEDVATVPSELVARAVRE
jgi:hypothetical protein